MEKYIKDYSAIVLGENVSTTIQIELSTKELLNSLKKSLHSETYDAVIQTLVRKKTKSMYGKLAGKRKISVSEMMKGLRDEDDRI